MTEAASVASPLDSNIVAWRHHGHGCDCEARLRGADLPRKQGYAVVICTYKRAASLNRFLDSLGLDEPPLDQLIIVDASPDDETERSLERRSSWRHAARCVIYARVAGPLKGLTRQRNFGVGLVATDLLAFFDDDIVLLPGCLREMVATHRRLGDGVAGVGARIEGAAAQTALWRLRMRLGMVSSLQPGTYQRSGLSVPWSFLPPTDEVVEGDWLLGGATMWKTASVRAVNFCEALGGYALGEDLDFSLRVRREGRLVMAGAARLLHLHDATGRPDHFQLGYMLIHNKYQIHRHALTDRNWQDVCWFIYTWTLDTLLLARHLPVPGRASATVREMGGRLRAAFDLVSGHRRSRLGSPVTKRN